MWWSAQFMTAASAVPICAAASPYQRWKSGSSVRLISAAAA